jgi:hypothetical protein
MKNKTMVVLMYFIFFTCKPAVTEYNWNGGKIVKPGVYQLSDSTLSVHIFLENNFVRYKVDQDDRTLIRHNYNISVYQNWAFYLDGQRNFWVFSSDIGHSVWRRMGDTYVEYTFNHILTRAEVPDDVYQNCKEFFYQEK